MKTLYGFILLILSYHGHTETLISGKAINGEGLELLVVAHSDLITNTEIELARSRIASNGDFEVRFTLRETKPVFLRIGGQEMEFVVEPGKSYNITISNLLEQQPRKKLPARFGMPALQYQISGSNRYELNAMIAEFYAIHDRFLQENVHALLRQRDNALTDMYSELINSSFPDFNNQYFKNLVFYNTALIRMMSPTTGIGQLYENYISGRPVLYSHPVYMEFFSQLFDKHLLTKAAYLRREGLLLLLSSSDSFQAIIKAMEADPVIKEMRVKELVLLFSLRDVYFMSGFNKEQVLNCLRQIQQMSTFSEHRLIARNMIASFAAH